MIVTVGTGVDSVVGMSVAHLVGAAVGVIVAVGFWLLA